MSNRNTAKVPVTSAPLIPLTEAERKIVERFVGGMGIQGRKKYRLTNEEIDRIIYGKH